MREREWGEQKREGESVPGSTRDCGIEQGLACINAGSNRKRGFEPTSKNQKWGRK